MLPRQEAPDLAGSEAGRSAPRDDLRGELATGLVDHLAVQHHRAPAVALGERGEDRLRAVDLLLAGREDGVQAARPGRGARPTCRRSPSARARRASSSSPSRSPTSRCGSVDGLQTGRPRGHEHRLAHPVPAVAWVVRAAARGPSEAARSAYPMISASSRGLGGRDLVHGPQAGGRLDQRLQPHGATPCSAPSSRSTASRSLGALHLGHHEAAERGTAVGREGRHVVRAPLARRRVHPHRDRRGRPTGPPASAAIAVAARLLLALGHDRVLEVHHHLVRGQATRLREHPLRGAGHRETRAARPHRLTIVRRAPGVRLPGCGRAGPRRTESGGGDTREGPSRRAALRGLRGGAGLRRTRPR